MAFNNRRLLFPLNTNLTYCSVCDNCIFCIPDEPLSPPLVPLPPPPPPLYFPPPLSPPPDQVSDQVKHISPLVIAIVVILASLFLIASYYAILVKYCSNWRNPRRRSPQQENTHEDFIDENQGPILDHPIWYITTVGLEQSIINAISVYKYKKSEGLVEGTDCSVCLSEFNEDDTLRLLPKCSHAFHLPCIDTWLRSHTNCPLCRAPIVTNAVRPNSNAIVPNSTAIVPNSNAIVPNSTAIVPYSNNSDVGVETRAEISEDDSVLVPDRSVVSVISDSGMGLDDDDDERELEEGRTDMGLIKEEEPSLENYEFRVLSDLADNRRLVENEIQLQPVRRSVSLDLSPASVFCFSMANSPPEEGEGSSAIQAVEDKNPNLTIVPKSPALGPSIGRLLQKGPVSMKRSFSSGGKFFLSRYSQNRSSILPL